MRYRGLAAVQKAGHFFRIAGLPRTIAAILLIMSALAPLEAQDAAPKPAGARLIAVFPYEAQDGALRPEHAFAGYAIPDMLRVNIAEGGRFMLCDKTLTEAAFASARGPSGEAPGAQALRDAARGLGADHFVWGYLVSASEELSVYQELIETESGSSVHASIARLPADSQIFDAAAESAREFAAWIGESLETRGPEIVYVDKEVVVEKPVVVEKEVPVDRYVEVPVRVSSGLSLSVDSGYRIFLPPFSSWLRPALRLGAAFDFKESKGGWGLGIALDSSPLVQKTGAIFAPDGIAILQASLLMTLSKRIALGKNLGLSLAAGAGGTAIAGLVSPQVVGYLRPEISLRADLDWALLPWLSLRPGLRAGAVFWAWQSDTMLDLEPNLDLSFRF